MFIHSPLAIESIPEEYRAAARALFPRPTAKNVEDYAEALSIDADYRRLALSSGDWTECLASFKNNFSLLIGKTWVEKSDEIRKKTLQARLPAFFAKIEAKNYKDAIKDFSIILEELAFLFFGRQSVMEDFTEYVFRINSQIGLFWWYGSRLSYLSQDITPDVERAVLTLGICYLTNF